MLQRSGRRACAVKPPREVSDDDALVARQPFHTQAMANVFPARECSQSDFELAWNCKIIHWSTDDDDVG
jgi:hypothetical protein